VTEAPVLISQASRRLPANVGFPVSSHRPEGTGRRKLMKSPFFTNYDAEFGSPVSWIVSV
jgi:hypothetical protein